jgi:patatin-like phospholipase/acyl hydrolase
MMDMDITSAAPIDDLCRILSLDGGGAKGFYTLGVLKELEGMLGAPLQGQTNMRGRWVVRGAVTRHT